MPHHDLHFWLTKFTLSDFLRSHVGEVVANIPEAVRADIVTDPGFVLFDYEPGTGIETVIPLGIPAFNRPGRSVVLKRTLRHRPESFVRYIIAHELAHAHLRNAGRFPGEDPEHAADALAAEWGFPNPATSSIGVL